MNPETFKGRWAQLKGEIEVQWGKLTNEDLDVIRGDQLKLIGLLQQRYGYAKEEASKQYDEFQRARTW